MTSINFYWRRQVFMALMMTVQKKSCAQYCNTSCQANYQAANTSSRRRSESESDDDPPGDNYYYYKIKLPVTSFIILIVENIPIKLCEGIKMQWYKFGDAIEVPRDYLARHSIGRGRVRVH